MQGLIIVVLFQQICFRSAKENSEYLRTDSLPSFVKKIPNVTVALGKDVILPCVVKNLGNYKIGWVKQDTQTILSLGRKVVKEAFRISVLHDFHKTWSLHIRQAKFEDRGCYMCQINTIEMQSQIGCIDVLIPPDIIIEKSSGDMIIKEYETLNLTCEAHGYPAPVIEWLREDKKPLYYNERPVYRINGSPLIVKNSTRKDAGTYLCIASNDVPPAVSKRIQVDVAFPPVITVVDVVDVDLVVRKLICHGEGFPLPEIRWRKDGKLILPSKKIDVGAEKLGRSKIVSYLKINSLYDENFGLYVCHMQNLEGNQTLEFLFLERLDKHALKMKQSENFLKSVVIKENSWELKVTNNSAHSEGAPDINSVSRYYWYDRGDVSTSVSCRMVSTLKITISMILFCYHFHTS